MSYKDRIDKYDPLNRAEIIRREIELRALKKSGIPKFTDFMDQIVQPKEQISRAQRIMCRIAFDGDSLSDLKVKKWGGEDISERDLAKLIFGDLTDIPQQARSIFVSANGARSGKTWLCSLRLLHLALTVDLSTLAHGERALAIIIAPTLANAAQAMRYILGAIENSSSLSALVVGKATENIIRLKRANNQIVNIEPRAAAKAGLSGRGFSICAALMDEVAFFRGSDYALNDDAIFGAVYARLLPGSQLLMPSTPWAREGLFYAKYEENFGHAVNAICAHAPTLLMFDSERNRHTYEMLLKSDPDKARNEYDAEFLSAAVEQFFDPVTIDRSIDDELNEGLGEPVEGAEVKAGADYGFERDASALVITHSFGGLHRVADIVHMVPEDGAALRPSEVVEEFAHHCRYHRAGWVASDVHYRQAIIEYLNAYGLFFVESPTDPAVAYVATRILMHQGLVRIPRNPKLVQQLRAIKAQRTPGGKVRILKPRTLGNHCDIVDAFVLAIYQAAGSVIPYAPPDITTPEGQEWINQSMKEGRRQTQMRDYDQRLNGKWWRTNPDERLRPQVRNRFHR